MNPLYAFPSALVALTLSGAAIADYDGNPPVCPSPTAVSGPVAVIPAIATDEDEIKVCLYDSTYSDYAAIELKDKQLTVTFHDIGPYTGFNGPITLLQSVGPLTPGTYSLNVILASPVGLPLYGYPRTIVQDMPYTVIPAGVSVSQPSTRAIEYYHPALDHYFLTTLRTEMRDLDSGVTEGWQRTGRSFKVSSDQTANAVCRFYIPPAQGDSHFYSASPQECAKVAAQHPDLILETSNLFRAALSNGSGDCTVSALRVYRLWNNRVDSNHRYTTDRGLRDEMVKAGYVSEGAGPAGVAFCAPR